MIKSEKSWSYKFNKGDVHVTAYSDDNRGLHLISIQEKNTGHPCFISVTWEYALFIRDAINQAMAEEAK